MERVLPCTLTLGTGRLSLGRLVQVVRLWRQRSRTRRQLATLDDHQLSDIGVSRSERMAEVGKPFWR